MAYCFLYGRKIIWERPKNRDNCLNKPLIIVLMELSELKKKVEEFDKEAGFDKTTFSELITMFEKELAILKANPEDKDTVRHQLTDLLMPIM